MPLLISDLPPSVAGFCAERHLATLTTLRADGTPHACPVGFTWDADDRVARIIAGGGSQKVRNVRRSPRVVICQVDGARWLALEGAAEVTDDPAEVAEAVRRYGDRYQPPRPNPARVAIVVRVDRILGRPASG